MGVCPCLSTGYRCLQSPEEGIGFSGAGVKGGFEALAVGAGTELGSSARAMNNLSC